MRVFSSFTPNPQSLLGQYLAQADSPPGPPPPAGRQSPWANAVVAALTEAGVAAQPAYPVGRHVVDVATVSKDRPVAVICGLHPDGIDAHINRHAALLRGGWLLVDALESRWGDRLAAATIELAYQLQTGTLA